MKKFSILSLVVALFAVSTAVAQDEQASPSDVPAPAAVVQPVIETQTVIQEGVQTVQEPVAVDSVIVPMEGQVAPVMSGNCCGSAQPMNGYQQPMAQGCCGAAPAMNNGCCNNRRWRGARVWRARPLFSRMRFRGNCCN